MAFGSDSSAIYPPRMIYWEITTGCNLRCATCQTHTSNLLSPVDLNYAESCCVIDQLAEYAPLTVVISGGEPLWRRDLFSLGKRARDKQLTTRLITNGTLIDETMAARIHDVGFERVAVNLDGADAQTHDGFRGQPGAFAAAVRGLRNLREMGVRTQIGAMITRHNAHQLSSMLTLADELGVQAFHVYLLVPVGCGFRIPEPHALRGDEADEILAWLYYRSISSTMEIKVTCAPHLHESPRGEREGKYGTPLVPSLGSCKSCLIGSGVCFISHSGEVYPCGYMPVSAGNLRTERFREIWEHSAALDAMRVNTSGEHACTCGEYSSLCSACYKTHVGFTECIPSPRRNGHKSLPVM